MARVQLALNVSDVDAAVAFYEKLFDTPPAKRRPAYANFVVDSPSLKLVLIENAAGAGTLNHLGVEVATTSEVTAAVARLSPLGDLHRPRRRRPAGSDLPLGSVTTRSWRGTPLTRAG